MYSWSRKIVLREAGNILKDHLERERLPYCIQMEAEEPALFRPEMVAEGSRKASPIGL